MLHFLAHGLWFTPFVDLDVLVQTFHLLMQPSSGGAEFIVAHVLRFIIFCPPEYVIKLDKAVGGCTLV